MSSRASREQCRVDQTGRRLNRILRDAARSGSRRLRRRARTRVDPSRGADGTAGRSGTGPTPGSGGTGHRLNTGRRQRISPRNLPRCERHPSRCRTCGGRRQPGTEWGRRARRRGPGRSHATTVSRLLRRAATRHQEPSTYPAAWSPAATSRSVSPAATNGMVTFGDPGGTTGMRHVGDPGGNRRHRPRSADPAAPPAATHIRRHPAAPPAATTTSGRVTGNDAPARAGTIGVIGVTSGGPGGITSGNDTSGRVCGNDGTRARRHLGVIGVTSGGPGGVTSGNDTSGRVCGNDGTERRHPRRHRRHIRRTRRHHLRQRHIRPRLRQRRQRRPRPALSASHPAAPAASPQATTHPAASAATTAETAPQDRRRRRHRRRRSRRRFRCRCCRCRCRSRCCRSRFRCRSRHRRRHRHTTTHSLGHSPSRRVGPGTCRPRVRVAYGRTGGCNIWSTPLMTTGDDQPAVSTPTGVVPW